MPKRELKVGWTMPTSGGKDGSRRPKIRPNAGSKKQRNTQNCGEQKPENCGEVAFWQAVIVQDLGPHENHDVRGQKGAGDQEKRVLLFSRNPEKQPVLSRRDGRQNLRSALRTVHKFFRKVEELPLRRN